MYAAVGSYIARAWRVLNLSFKPYPRRRYTVLLALAIYGNFFADHFHIDFRYVLFVAVIVLFWRVQVSYSIDVKRRHMHLVVGFALIALFIWLAENIGTFTRTWLYPAQIHHWQPVGASKLGSWFLLMIISFIMVDILYYVRTQNSKHV